MRPIHMLQLEVAVAVLAVILWLLVGGAVVIETYGLSGLDTYGSCVATTAWCAGWLVSDDRPAGSSPSIGR